MVGRVDLVKSPHLIDTNYYVLGTTDIDHVTVISS